MLMMQNPLTIPILEILRQSSQDLSEYDIIKQLEQGGIEFPGAGETFEMAMFKKHFMTMNALYQLQRELFDDGYFLCITAVRVSLRSLMPFTDSNALTDDSENRVRDYYLDWRHFEETGQQDVEDLLNSFWEKYYALDKQAQALAILELDAHCGWQQVQSRYRHLASQHHPDRGGDPTRFIEIREAYEILRRCYG